MAEQAQEDQQQGQVERPEFHAVEVTHAAISFLLNYLAPYQGAHRTTRTAPVKIAIIGTGKVGEALARAFTRAGHSVTLGSRHPQARADGLTETAPAAAVADAETVVLALPWAAAEAAIRALGPLAGKIVIDCMNPLGPAPEGLGLTLGHTTSGGETLAAWLPEARVVKTLNTVGAEVMADARAFAHPPAMLMAGEDDGAKATVASLLAGIGFDPLDAGGIARSRLLEPFALVWINQAIFRAKGRNWAFAAIPKAPPP
ncbi:MAG: NADPH-dependent F420 reductase [Paracoccaceae bacterium]